MITMSLYRKLKELINNQHPKILMIKILFLNLITW